MIVANTDIPVTNLVVRADNWTNDACVNRVPARPSSNSQSGNVCIDEQLKGDRKLGTLRAVSLLQAAAVRATPNVPR